jgi:hypothetical protein
MWLTIKRKNFTVIKPCIISRDCVKRNYRFTWFNISSLQARDFNPDLLPMTPGGHVLCRKHGVNLRCLARALSSCFVEIFPDEIEIIGVDKKENPAIL